MFFAYRVYRRTGYSSMIIVGGGFGLIGIVRKIVERGFKALEYRRFFF